MDKTTNVVTSRSYIIVTSLLKGYTVYFRNCELHIQIHFPLFCMCESCKMKIAINWFREEVTYIVLRVRQNVRLVNAPRANKRQNLSFGLENNFDTRPVGNLRIQFIQLGFVQLFECRLRLRPSYVVSKCGVEAYIQVCFKLPKITLECKLWCQSSYLVYVVSRH